MCRKIGSAHDPKQTTSPEKHGGVSMFLELAHLSFIMILLLTPAAERSQKHRNSPDPTQRFEAQWTVHHLADEKYLETSCYISCAVFGDPPKNPQTIKSFFTDQ